jgi:hypothetical protein
MAQPAGAASSNMGEIGTVTKPTFSGASGKMKDFVKTASKLKKQIQAIEYREKLLNSQYRLTKDDITVVANKDEENTLTLTGFYKDQVALTMESAPYTVIAQKFEQNSEEVANEMIRQIKASLELRNTKEPEKIMENLEPKTAAGKGLTPDSKQMTTEKQLQDAKLELHPRTGKAPEGVTESKEQLGLAKEPYNDTTSESPQVRKGEYAEVTTDGQLAEFKDSPLARWNEYSDVITEKTFTDWSRAVGSELKTDQAEHTTEGQVQDLLSHHRWTEPKVTTENQLKDTANWLSQDNAWLDKSAAASYAKALVASAVEALSDAVAKYKRTPGEVVKAAKYISKDPQSQIKAAFLTLVNGKPLNRQARKVEVARASYFGKTASDISAVDALLACMGDNCVNLKAEDFVEAIRYVASDTTRMAAVESKAQIKLAEKVEIEEAVDKFSAFDDAFKSMNVAQAQPVAAAPAQIDEEASADGLHEVTATVEDLGIDVSDEVALVAAAEKYAKTQVSPDLATVLYNVAVDREAGVVITTLKEASMLTSEEKELVKIAQMGGQLGGGMDGGAGAGASMPAPPGAGGAGAPPVPPVESLQGAPGEEPGMDEEEGGDKEAMPPGSICPVCGSNDVDIVEGKGKCNNCNSQFVFKVNVEVTRWTGVNDQNSADGAGDEPGLPGDDGLADDAGQGFPMPEAGAAEAGAAPSIPVAAMTRLNPDVIKKVSNKQLGAISPLTGSDNTFALGNGKHLCMDTGSTYELITIADKKNPKYVWAEWRWTPKFVGAECSSCRRAKSAWASALKKAGLTNEQFEVLSFTKKADKILEMEAKNLFATVKTASKNSSVVAEYKKAFTVEGKFPIESCREKIARRYGEEAVAISGPCKGEKLYDCVCNQLKSASVYNDTLAMKLASAWKDRDGCLECIEDYTRFGYDIEKAASVCNHMKVRYASPEDMFADEMSDAPDTDPTDPNGPGGGAPTDAGDDFGNEDPFASEGAPSPEGDAGGAPSAEGAPSPEMGGEPGSEDAVGLEIDLEPSAPGADVGLDVGPTGPGVPGDDGAHGEVTIKLPLQALDAIEEAIQKAHGDTPGEGLEVPPGEGDTEVAIDLPGEAVEEIGDVAGDELAPSAPGESEDPSAELGGEGEGQGASEDPMDDAGSDESAAPGGSEEPEGDSSPFGSENKEPEMAEQEADHFANVMRRGKRVGQIDIDVASIARTIQRKTAGESEPKLEKAQDAVDKYQDGKTLGNEEKFDPAKPSVPRGNATMGKEPSDSNPKDKPLPKVPSGGGEMGHEKEMGYTSEGTSMTGGDKGQGKTETATANKSTKVADKKVGPAKPVSEQTKVDFSGNKDHENTPEQMKRIPFEESDSKETKNIPEKGEGAFIGDEKSSIGDVPKADQKFAPSIPAGGGRNEKYDKNEKNAPELLTDIKGTAIAKSDEKSKVAQTEAIRIAGRMIEAGLIEASQLSKKIAELSGYKLETLADIEKSLFKSAAKKGFAAESDGIEKSPVIISESSGQRNKSDLTEQLKSLFSLNTRNQLASENTDADLRRSHNRG